MPNLHNHLRIFSATACLLGLVFNLFEGLEDKDYDRRYQRGSKHPTEKPIEKTTLTDTNWCKGYRTDRRYRKFDNKRSLKTRFNINLRCMEDTNSGWELSIFVKWTKLTIFRAAAMAQIRAVNKTKKYYDTSL